MKIVEYFYKIWLFFFKFKPGETIAIVKFNMKVW
jgi:hypothetical protein